MPNYVYRASEGGLFRELPPMRGMTPMDAEMAVEDLTNLQTQLAERDKRIAELEGFLYTSSTDVIEKLEGKVAEQAAEIERLNQRNGCEAEELRKGIENLVDYWADIEVPTKELSRLLDRVDARDSLESLEQLQAHKDFVAAFDDYHDTRARDAMPFSELRKARDRLKGVSDD